MKTEKVILFDTKAQVIVGYDENVYGGIEERLEWKTITQCDFVTGWSDENIRERMDIIAKISEEHSNEKKYSNIRLFEIGFVETSKERVVVTRTGAKESLSCYLVGDYYTVFTDEIPNYIGEIKDTTFDVPLDEMRRKVEELFER